MQYASESIITDIGLAEAGQKKIDWVARHSPVLNQLAERYLADGTFEGRRVAVVVHLEAKTAYLAQLFHQAGAEVTVAGSNPLTTQDTAAAALVKRGIRVFATHGASEEAFEEQLQRVIDAGPEFVVDDGAELVTRAHQQDLAQFSVLGSSEETTTGVVKLRAMDGKGKLRWPAIAANDALCKHLFDNRYGTGHSTVGAVMDTTNLMMGGKQVVVIGYGWCGKGIARHASGLGARVIVSEVDPVRALEAYADGYTVMSTGEAAAAGDIFITATGGMHALDRSHFETMKDGAIVCNAGHYALEIDTGALEELAVENVEVRQHIREFRFEDGRRIHLISEGDLVNIAAGDGHPVEIMDLTFAVQALSAHYLVNHHDELEPGLHRFPRHLDETIARTKLETLGCSLNQLTDAQRAYLDSWQ